MHDAIFEQVNQYIDYPVHWLPLEESGTSNWLYRGSNHQQALILRINARDSIAFGVNRLREKEVLNSIQPFSWSVKVLADAPKEGWCVMKHHGLGLNGAVLTESMEQQLLSAVADCQIIFSPPKLNYPDLFLDYQTALNKLPDAEEWLKKLNQLLGLFQTLPRVSSCLTHHDLHPGNFCWQNDQLVIIDWEYAGVGNPWLDACMLYSACQVSADKISVLPAFSSLSEEAFSQGLEQAVQVGQLLEQLWFRVRA